MARTASDLQHLACLREELADREWRPSEHVLKWELQWLASTVTWDRPTVGCDLHLDLWANHRTVVQALAVLGVGVGS